MKDYDAYLFDWDGTLARTVEIWIRELHAHAIEYGLNVTIEDTARHFGDLRWVNKRGLPDEQSDKFQQELFDIVYPQLLTVPLYEGAEEMLGALKARGKHLALITTSHRTMLDAVLDRHPHLAALFEVIITMRDVERHKPDPEGINKALARLGVPKERTLMLGDTGKDLEAAQNAGTDSLLYYPPVHHVMYEREHLLSFQPTHVIENWQELTEQLQ